MKRFFFAAGFSVLMTLLAMVTVWLSIGAGFYSSHVLLYRNSAMIRNFETIIQEHISENRSFPLDASEFLSHDFGEIHNAGKDHTRDAWGRPWIYESDGTTITIKTLGRDGKPGGTGFDFDLSTLNRERESDTIMKQAIMSEMTRPGLFQFWFELPTKPVWKGLMVTAVLSFVLAMLIYPFRRDNPRGNALGVIAIMAVLLLIVSILAAIDVPSNH